MQAYVAANPLCLHSREKIGESPHSRSLVCLLRRKRQGHGGLETAGVHEKEDRQCEPRPENQPRNAKDPKDPDKSYAEPSKGELQRTERDTAARTNPGGVKSSSPGNNKSDRKSEDPEDCSREDPEPAGRRQRQAHQGVQERHQGGATGAGSRVIGTTG